MAVIIGPDDHSIKFGPNLTCNWPKRIRFRSKNACAS
jgi:hypothetical protein